MPYCPTKSMDGMRFRESNILNCHTAIHAVHTHPESAVPPFRLKRLRIHVPILSPVRRAMGWLVLPYLAPGAPSSRRCDVRASTEEACHGGVLAEGARPG